MHSRWITGLIIVVAAGLVGSGPAGAAGPRTLVVDDDRVQCPGATFKTIQPAVKAAKAGDTVLVCGGAYAGNVVLSRGAHLVAHSPAAPMVDCLAGGGAGADAAVVTGAITVTGAGATVDGLIITGAPTGITTSQDSSGYQIRRNVIQGNTFFGIEVQSSGTRKTTVESNCVRNNGATAGPGDRAGIAAENGALRNAVIRGNTTVDNGEGISVAGPYLHSDISITANVLRRESMAVSGTVASEITRNDIDIAGAGAVNGITIGGGNVGLAVSSNTIVGAAGGIFFTRIGFNVPNMAANVGLLLTGNTIRDGVGSGISMAPPIEGAPGEVTRSLFYRNTIQRNPASGLILSAGSDGNALIANTSSDNVRGIFLNGAVGTLVLGNTMAGNSSVDARDIAAAGQNTWIANRCTIDDPDGALCSAPVAGASGVGASGAGASGTGASGAGASGAGASGGADARTTAPTLPLVPARPKVDRSHWPCLGVPVWDVDPVDGGAWVWIRVVAPDAPPGTYCGT